MRSSILRTLDSSAPSMSRIGSPGSTRSIIARRSSGSSSARTSFARSPAGSRHSPTPARCPWISSTRCYGSGSLPKTVAEKILSRVAARDATAPTPVVADSHRVLREWVRAQGIATFYDAGEGVCHQIMVEEGYCEPGTVIVGSDSHSNSYGAVGAFGAGMGATDIAVALALGRTWLRVPESIKVSFTGKLRKGITMKDAIMRVVREIGTDGARYASVEFHGVGDLPQGDRITLAGMTTEMGAKAGLVVGTPEAPDWLFPDRGATYANEVTIDLTTLEPQIAVPPRVDQVVDVPAAVVQPVDAVFLGSCTNGRLVDMRQAASVLRGRRISAEVRLEVVPSSRRQFEDAMADGTLLSLSAAGAVIGSSGCGPW